MVYVNRPGLSSGIRVHMLQLVNHYRFLINLNVTSMEAPRWNRSDIDKAHQRAPAYILKYVFLSDNEST